MQSGYYEAKLNERTTLTEEQMKQFEEDIKNGKEIDLNNYLAEQRRDFSNGATKAGVAVSNIIENVFAEGFTRLGDILKKLFT